MKTVLSTKTLDTGTLAYALTKNLEVKCVDFIETTAIPFDIENIHPDSFDAVVFTSANAVKCFFEDKKTAAFIQHKQVFALQGKTKDELEAKGIETGVTAASAGELADAIIAAKSAKSVMHVCGNLKLPVLETKLTEAGIIYSDFIVYQTTNRPNQKVSEAFNAILFFSPSGVESFLTGNNFGDKTVCCCIGPTTAQFLKEKKITANIILPAQPSPVSMLTAVADYIKGS